MSYIELEDDDAAITLVFLVVPLVAGLGRLAMERQLEPRATCVLLPNPFLFFPLPNLLDDERR